MTCTKAERLLTRALDGELGAAERAALDAHLAACAACRDAERAWRQAGDLLRGAVVPAPPVEVMQADVLRAIRQLPRQPAGASLPGWRLKWATAIVAAVFVGILGLATWRLRAPATPAVAQAAPTVEWVEAELAGSSPMVYEDEESGMVVIWLMTAENDEPTPKG